MGRPILTDHGINRQGLAAPLRPFLQRRLGILGRRQGGIHQRRPGTADESGGDIEAGIGVKRADHRLASVGQQAGIGPAARFLLALGQGQARRQADTLGHRGQGFASHQGRVTAGQGSLRFGGKALEQHVGDDQTEHAVAQEFQPFIGRAAARRPPLDHRWMCQGLNQQIVMGEVMAQVLA